MLNRDQEKYNRLQQKLWREMGEVIPEWIASKQIVEIMLNPDGKLWFQHADEGVCNSGQKLSAVNAANLIGTIASLNDKIVNDHHPILECELPSLGHRFQALLPPIVSAPTFCIRKRAIQIFTLNDYVEQGILSFTQANHLREAIRNRKTILIVGGPGTGKTTFANALLDEIVKQCDSSQRILILEDTHELQSSAPNTVFLKTTADISFQQLLRAALRLRPDRICMGECRGAEMLTLLKCWNTGTPGGLATLHANSAKSALTRIQEMVAESGSIPQPQLITEAVNVIVSLAFHPVKGRVVSDIIEVLGHQNQDFQLKSLSKWSPSCISSFNT